MPMLTVRMNAVLYESFKELAMLHGQSMNQMAVNVLEKVIEQAKNERKRNLLEKAIKRAVALGLHFPSVGNQYWSKFESDYDARFDDPEHVFVLGNLTPELMRIQDVEQQNDDGIGWCITAVDGDSYDCYWSKKLGIWVYSLQ